MKTRPPGHGARQGLALLLLLGTLLGVTAWAWAATSQALLRERHQAAGLGCDACHTESPPRTATPAARCLACHGGTYPRLAENTQTIAPANPHDPHEGDIECGECHHVHKPSVDYCARCHQFGFRVP